MTGGYGINIEKATLENNNVRKVPAYLTTCKSLTSETF